MHVCACLRLCVNNLHEVVDLLPLLTYRKYCECDVYEHVCMSASACLSVDRNEIGIYEFFNLLFVCNNINNKQICIAP